jgi:hypothetical protein
MIVKRPGMLLRKIIQQTPIIGMYVEIGYYNLAGTHKTSLGNINRCCIRPCDQETWSTTAQYRAVKEH